MGFVPVSPGCPNLIGYYCYYGEQYEERVTSENVLGHSRYYLMVLEKCPLTSGVSAHFIFTIKGVLLNFLQQ